VSRPSLGPYSVTSATPSRIVLAMNKTVAARAPTASATSSSPTAERCPTSAGAHFVKLLALVNRAQEQALSAHPNVISHIGTSSNIEEMTFAPDGP
jgi:hypothetical protein